MRTEVIDDAIQTLLDADAPEREKRNLLERLRAVREGLCSRADCTRWCHAMCLEGDRKVA